MTYATLKRGTAILATMVVVGGVFGCSNDPKAATTENFARAISNSYDKVEGDKSRSICLNYEDEMPNVPGFVVPITPSTFTLAHSSDEKKFNPYMGMSGKYYHLVTDHGDIEKLQVLTSVGVIIKKPTTVPGNEEHLGAMDPFWHMRRPSHYEKIAIPAFEYTSTPASYCFANFGFDHVDNFSVPGDLMGKRVTVVSYYREIESVKGWARDARVQAAFPEIEQSLGKIKDEPANIALELTNNGWQVAQ